MLFFVTLGIRECILLAAMVYYGHYIAIYNPLLYAMSMSPRAYIITSHVDRVLHGTTQIVGTFRKAILVIFGVCFVLFILWDFVASNSRVSLPHEC